MIGKRLPRGLRNNNPLNIRRTKDKWKGLRHVQADAQFCQFETMAMGWRAAFWLLTRTYYHKYRCTTIASIITRWAPPGDGNATLSYIKRVEQLTGIDRKAELGTPSFHQGTWLKVGLAMAIVENGTQVLDYFAMLDGWQMCRNEAVNGGMEPR